MSDDAARPPAAEDITRVPFWIVLAGVGAGAFWALAGVALGARLARRRHDRAFLAGVTSARPDLLAWRRPAGPGMRRGR
jgi:hypothetical protein